jgi:hypothetical protein
MSFDGCILCITPFAGGLEQERGGSIVVESITKSIIICQQILSCRSTDVLKRGTHRPQEMFSV